MKKSSKVLCVVPWLLSLTGCAGVVSLHPLAIPNAKDTVFEPALLGNWEEVKADSDGRKSRYTVERGESGYKVTLVAGSDKVQGTMRLMKLGDEYLLDVLYPSDGAPPPVHLFARLRMDKDTAWVSEMNTPWLRERIEACGLRHEVVLEDGEKLVLTASTAELRRLLLPLARDDRAFAEEFELRRMAAARTGQTNGLTVERLQKEFPLNIVAATFGDDLRVLAVNLSNRHVTEATLGVLLKDPASATPVTRTGELCRAKVAPGGSLLITGRYGGFAAVDSYFRGKSMKDREVSLGITHVRFADGSEWNLPIEAPGRFDGDDDPQIRKRIERLFPGHDLGMLYDPGRRGATCGN